MRSFSGAVISALQAEAGERVHLIELTYSTSTLRLATSATDISWNSQTWTAVGGALTVGPIEESGDQRRGLELTLSGVDQSVTDILLSEDFRGRSANVWQAILDQSAGTVTDAIPLFVDGLQLDNYEVEEKVQRGKPVTCTVRTRVMHRLASNEFRGIRTNPHSHQEHYENDTFFQHVAAFASRKLFWGIPSPSVAGGGFPPPSGGFGGTIGDITHRPGDGGLL